MNSFVVFLYNKKKSELLVNGLDLIKIIYDNGPKSRMNKWILVILKQSYLPQ